MVLSPELLSRLPEGAAALGLLTIAFLALTQKQRLSVVERDECRCQAKGIIPHKCVESDRPLEVHHILNQAYLNLLKVNPDYALNLITVCRAAHDAIHPWRVWARKNYHQYKQRGLDTFKIAQAEVRQKLAVHEIPWEDEWDRQLLTVAAKNTQRSDFVLPEKRKAKDCA